MLDDLVPIIKPVATLLEVHVLNPIHSGSAITLDEALLSGGLPSSSIEPVGSAKSGANDGGGANRGDADATAEEDATTVW